MSTLRVAAIGNYRAPWCTEVHLARELEGLGCEVKQFQEPSEPRHHGKFLAGLEQWCLATKPDLLMFTRTWGLPEETTALWRRLEEAGIVTCSYHLDLYVGLKRGERILDDPFWTTQHVFTPDGDPRSVEFFKANGINHHWSSPAVVSDECVPGEFRPEYAFDVVFVGSYGYHDEWPWRPQLIDYLKDRYGPRFRRFGGDLPEGPVRGQRLNDLYASAKVVVGDSLTLPGHINYWSDRYFETVGRGGFLIAPYVEGISDFLLPLKHLDYYLHPGGNLSTDGALDALGRQVDYWLERPDARRQIQDQGQSHVRAHHTYRHRLARALTTMGFAPKPLMGRPVDWVEHPNFTDEPFEGNQSLTITEGSLTQTSLVRQSSRFVERSHIDKLELGSGYYPTPGFVHLDLNPNCPDVDIVGTAWPLELPDNSVGEIRAVDVLEHLSYRHTEEILADWFRVLEPGGKLYVQVPAADVIMYWFVNTPMRLLEKSEVAGVSPVTPLSMAAWRLLGGHEDDVHTKKGEGMTLNAHYALFDAFSLEAALNRAGFVVDELVTNDHPNLLCWASRP